MTTVFDISLQVMKQVTDVLEGAATDGATTYLKDTDNLIQTNEWFDRGTLWIKSGTHVGKVLRVTGHASNKLTFTALLSAIAAGTRYAVTRHLYPWEQVLTMIQSALDETWVEGEDDSLLGDGETLEFVLPTGVYNILRVEIERENCPRFTSNHWHEHPGALRFNYGRAPYNDDVLHVFYKANHAEITTYSDEINKEVDRDWLVLTAARDLLFWGASQYGIKTNMIEDRLNKVLGALKGKNARVHGPNVIMKAGG